jgi:sulfur-oxidizing protein SoxX
VRIWHTQSSVNLSRRPQLTTGETAAPFDGASGRGARRATNSRRPLVGRIVAGLFLLTCSRAVAFEVVGDAIPSPLGGLPGDAARGRALVLDRQRGLCLLCHSGPFPEERFQGNLAPSLAGAGRRWSEGQLRLRLVDSKRLNSDTIMPSYGRTEGLHRVAPAFQGRPVLGHQEIEDLVAYLLTLREDPSP